MSDTSDKPARERVIEPPAGHHEAPMPDKPIPTNEARQGVTIGRVRWVLLISLVLVVLGFIASAVLST
ncbi:hypothetical protein ACFFMP_09220 [Pseudoroseomonas cervicalis]|uniref:Uncharacterized protein n=1 Tax=Pseudoroseomonas cervicalis ATCC 49957 TaxID=525371 RepID=D5RRC3_9PROT|nr:hypothetical protein [Pseudoroseomonas cervicalis]EFH10147.1 hypothetical protein HMPREF0731_3635 [Pseudoroseomonas cervicalis ATCC 49957]